MSAVTGLRWRSGARRSDRSVAVMMVAAVVVAWVALVVMTIGGSSGGRPGASMSGMSGMSMSSMPGMSSMANMPGMSGMSMGSGHGAQANGDSLLLGSGAALAIAMWLAMVVAMMFPAAVPAAQHVAANSLRWRRWRATATFLAVYAVIWIAFGALLFAASPLWSAVNRTAVFAIALALAAGWQLTAYKRRGLRDCHLSSPLPPRGSRATAGVIRFASRNGGACLRSCWAMMLAMAVASSMTIFWMVAITGIVTTEKLVTKPRQATRIAALVLGAGALVTGASIILG